VKDSQDLGLVQLDIMQGPEPPFIRHY